jgi:prevent-host-death family protein
MASAVNVHEAKTQFSQLLRRVQLGEEIVIAKAGKPVARLIPFAAPPSARKPGTARGMITMSPDFDAPLPEDLEKAFED